MKTLTAKDILNIISKPWGTTKDIMMIGSVGKGTALSIKREIKQKAEESGFYTPTNLVSMEDIVNYFNLNISYLKKVRGISEEEVTQSEEQRKENGSNN